jgi:membrane-associated protease RseP (regulator of RpoE activity)
MPKVAPMPPMPPMPNVHMKFEMPEIYSISSPGRVGLVVESLTPQLGEFFGVKSGDGLLVRSVEKGSPADAAGFRAGDVIVKVDAQGVSDRNDWRSTLRNKTGKVPVVVVREKRERTLTLVLPDRKQSSRGRVIVVPDEDIQMVIDDVAELGPEVTDLAMAEVQAELAKSRVEIRKSVSKAKEQMRQHKEELKREQKEMLKQQKEMMKEQKEMMKEQPDPDDEN